MCPEFTREVTDTQMPLVAPVILPEMYKIFTMAEVLPQLLSYCETRPDEEYSHCITFSYLLVVTVLSHVADILCCSALCLT